MCQFKSGIVLPGKIIVPLDKDSHNEILNDLGIKDNTEFPNFVRIECVPLDGDIFNHNIDNWSVKVDQDFLPEWFDKAKTEKLMKEIYMPEVFEKSFIIGREIEEINSGRWFVKNGIVQKLSGNAIIEQMRESSTVNEMRGSSTARKFVFNKKSQIFVPKGSFEIVEI